MAHGRRFMVKGRLNYCRSKAPAATPADPPCAVKIAIARKAAPQYAIGTA
jgi:hypothetical protein